MTERLLARRHANCNSTNDYKRLGRAMKWRRDKTCLYFSQTCFLPEIEFVKWKNEIANLALPDANLAIAALEILHK